MKVTRRQFEALAKLRLGAELRIARRRIVVVTIHREKEGYLASSEMRMGRYSAFLGDVLFLTDSKAEAALNAVKLARRIADRKVADGLEVRDSRKILFSDYGL